MKLGCGTQYVTSVREKKKIGMSHNPLRLTLQKTEGLEGNESRIALLGSR